MSFVNRPCGFRGVKRNRCPQRRSQVGIIRHFCSHGGWQAAQAAVGAVVLLVRTSGVPRATPTG